MAQLDTVAAGRPAGGNLKPTGRGPREAGVIGHGPMSRTATKWVLFVADIRTYLHMRMHQGDAWAAALRVIDARDRGPDYEER
jgi:hypothetical protein